MEGLSVYMFIRGLHFILRQQLATVNPNPNNLNRLINDVIVIENLNFTTLMNFTLEIVISLVPLILVQEMIL